MLTFNEAQNNVRYRYRRYPSWASKHEPYEVDFDINQKYREPVPDMRVYENDRVVFRSCYDGQPDIRNRLETMGFIFRTPRASPGFSYYTPDGLPVTKEALSGWGPMYHNFEHNMALRTSWSDPITLYGKYARPIGGRKIPICVHDPAEFKRVSKLLAPLKKLAKTTHALRSKEHELKMWSTTVEVVERLKDYLEFNGGTETRHGLYFLLAVGREIDCGSWNYLIKRQVIGKLAECPYLTFKEKHG